MKVIKIKKSNTKARLEIGYTTSGKDCSFPYAQQHSEKYRKQVNAMLADGVTLRDFNSYILVLK